MGVPKPPSLPPSSLVPEVSPGEPPSGRVPLLPLGTTPSSAVCAAAGMVPLVWLMLTATFTVAVAVSVLPSTACRTPEPETEPPTVITVGLPPVSVPRSGRVNENTVSPSRSAVKGSVVPSVFVAVRVKFFDCGVTPSLVTDQLVGVKAIDAMSEMSTGPPPPPSSPQIRHGPASPPSPPPSPLPLGAVASGPGKWLCSPSVDPHAARAPPVATASPSTR